jgi:hypothetical protein
MASESTRLTFLAAALAASIRVGGAAPIEVGATPTFTKDVAPILFANCVRCHREGGSASSIPLESYEAALRKSKELRDMVSRREMPPWPADSAHSLKFSNDPRLSQADIDTLVGWVDGGSPRGNDADLVAPPHFNGGWLNPSGRAPDAVVTLPKYTVAANGTIPYIQRLIKVPYKDDRWIAALQVRAGNPLLLHHMGITEVELPKGMTPETMDAFDAVARQIGAPSGQLQIQTPAVTDSADPGAYDMLAVYTPGTTFETYGEGNGKLLKGGGNYYLNFNIHYTTTGKPETDLTQLALWLQPSPPRHVLYRLPSAVNSIIANGRELLSDDPGTKAEGTAYALPPITVNQEHYELIGVSAYQRAITLYQLQPHAHVRATDFSYVAVYPDGRELSVLSVPHYSYHFQLAYELAAPLNLPAGSKMIVTAHYDNSPRNEHLQHLGSNEAARKCGPENVAFFAAQNQSWDEMFSPLMQYSVDAESQRSLPLVSAVGCLVKDRAGGWILSHGSRALATREQGTSRTELDTTSRRMLGSERYQLIGVDVFTPTNVGNARVAVKGVLISTPGGRRINVTSLQSLAADCPH